MHDSEFKALRKQRYLLVLLIPCAILILYWFLFDLGCAFDFGFLIQKTLGIRTWFRDEAVVLPIICSFIIFPLTAVICTLFYRGKFSLWLKLLLLFTGGIHATTAIFINTAIFKANQCNEPVIGWQILLAVYAIETLAVFIWFTASVIKCLKKQ